MATRLFQKRPEVCDSSGSGRVKVKVTYGPKFIHVAMISDGVFRSNNGYAVSLPVTLCHSQRNGS